MLIHAIKFAQQPDIQFMCDDVWGLPAWGDQPEREQRIYLADVNQYTEIRKYTWEHAHVTCPKCLEIQGPSPKRLTEEEEDKLLQDLHKRAADFREKVRKRQESEKMEMKHNV